MSTGRRSPALLSESLQDEDPVTDGMTRIWIYPCTIGIGRSESRTAAIGECSRWSRNVVSQDASYTDLSIEPE